MRPMCQSSPSGGMSSGDPLGGALGKRHVEHAGDLLDAEGVVDRAGEGEIDDRHRRMRNG